MTDRLFLRLFRTEDGPAFYENVMSDIETAEIFGIDAGSPAAAQAYTEAREKYSGRPGFYDYAVVRSADNVLLGEINAAYIPPDTADIGYVIGRKYRGNGYAAEALDLLLRRLFEEGITTVYGACRPDNPASEAVMRACGMTEAVSVPDNVKQRETETGLKWFVKQIG